MTVLILLMCAGRAVNAIVQNENGRHAAELPTVASSWQFIRELPALRPLAFWNRTAMLSFVGWVHDEGWW